MQVEMRAERCACDAERLERPHGVGVPLGGRPLPPLPDGVMANAGRFRVPYCEVIAAAVYARPRWCRGGQACAVALWRTPMW